MKETFARCSLPGSDLVRRQTASPPSTRNWEGTRTPRLQWAAGMMKEAFAGRGPPGSNLMGRQNTSPLGGRSRGGTGTPSERFYE